MLIIILSLISWIFIVLMKKRLSDFLSLIVPSFIGGILIVALDKETFVDVRLLSVIGNLILVFAYTGLIGGFLTILQKISVNRVMQYFLAFLSGLLFCVLLSVSYGDLSLTTNFILNAATLGLTFVLVEFLYRVMAPYFSIGPSGKRYVGDH